ncbi:hypothetical protein JCGZ_10606 [Jatropha curcas]|uniref:DUF676 domain-containing protein n=1 Tax=Jatropha curcas TaxID=180498 RepID=A0A067KI21_JATCU|nr:hypothetical protein JCGZ_10606 [Jatropha curcas]
MDFLFIAHSLGGLFARYAIAVLYSEAALSIGQSSDTTDSITSSARCKTMYHCWVGPNQLYYPGNSTSWSERKKAGLSWRLPFLLGIPILEKLAPPIAPIFTGRTGSQLFLTHGKPNKPPLLLRMASDCEDGKFISALGAFGCRILYANVSYDHMVGWSTSSIRREKELVKPPRHSLDGYKHVVDVEYCPPLSSEGPQFPPEAVKAKEAAQKEPNTRNTVEYHEIIEEEMIHGLQQLGWKKVNVKNEWLHNAGAGVIAHFADSLKQQESSSLIIAIL